MDIKRYFSQYYFSYFIASRYFISFQKKGFINFLTLISVLVVAVGSMALVIVLSVFNGMETLIRSLYQTFDPDLKIEKVEGKFFEWNDSLRTKLVETPGVVSYSKVLEDNALMKYGDNQLFVRLKGVDSSYYLNSHFSSAMAFGEFNLGSEASPKAVIGQGVQYILGIPHTETGPYLQVWYPKSDLNAALSSGNGFRRKNLAKSGIFALEKQYDDKYVFVPIVFADELFDSRGQISSLEVTVDKRLGLNKVQKNLKQRLGDSFRVLNSDEQHQSLLRAIKIEKLFVFLTFGFILFLASFNIFFSLSMLVIEKRRDIKMMFALGASPSHIRTLFMLEGGLIAFTGASSGLLLGLVVGLVQKQFGIFTMGMTGSVVQAYPIEFEWDNFLLSGLMIYCITLLACIRPSNRAARMVTAGV